jgi:hypothetical protein
MWTLLPPLLCPTLPLASGPAPAPLAKADAPAAEASLLGPPAGQVSFTGAPLTYEGHTLRWRFLQAQGELGEPDGWRLSGSTPLNQHLALQGNLLLFDENNVEGALFGFGALVHRPLPAFESEQDGPFKEFEVFGALNLLHLSANGSENGYSAEAGARAILRERIEGELALGYRDLGPGDLYGRVRGEYQLDGSVGLTAGAEVSDDSIVFVGLRFYPARQD